MCKRKIPKIKIISEFLGGQHHGFWLFPVVANGSTSSHTFIYSKVLFIIHNVLSQIEGMWRSVEDNYGEEEHKELEIRPFF